MADATQISGSPRTRIAILGSGSQALIPACLPPLALGLCGWNSELGALILGGAIFYQALVFASFPTTYHARKVFRTSLVFFPALPLLFVLDAALFNRR
jgi:heme O synthase-like polyprenyltransferase